MEPTQGPPPAAPLSLPGRLVVAMTVGAVTVGALYHLAMVFLHVAPPNTLSNEHAAAVSDYIYPEFEQNWKLFAPDPLQQNIHVQARAEVRKPDGSTEVTGWVDMTAIDITAMRHNPIPSHTEQNELRRAWSFYTDSHNDQEQATAGDRSTMSSTYLLRILQERFGPKLNGGDVFGIQARSATTPVPQPSWIANPAPAATQYRVLPWWKVTAASSAGSSSDAPSDSPSSSSSGPPAGSSSTATPSGQENAS